MSFGVPFLCISTKSELYSFANSTNFGSSSNALTSFIIVAPKSSACFATSYLVVSIDIVIFLSTSRIPFITGIVRLISSPNWTGSDPGRVLSPPISIISAPSSISFKA